jgi:pimeloyl-ACP methyl ester carboxylesterase
MLQTIDIKLQSQGQPLIPSAEHQRLDLFVGKWKTGGHFMFIENPDKFNQRVLQFLSRSLQANQDVI